MHEHFPREAGVLYALSTLSVLHMASVEIFLANRSCANTKQLLPYSHGGRLRTYTVAYCPGFLHLKTGLVLCGSPHNLLLAMAALYKGQSSYHV